MSEYAEAAKRLRDLFLFLQENNVPVPKTEFTSNMGEWLVMDQLIGDGYSPTLLSGQNDVDIHLSNGEGVEVKSATWDSDFGGVYRFDRINPDKLDYLICVKLKDDYTGAEYFAFSGEDANSIPPRNRSAFNDSDRTDNQRLLRILDNPENANREDMRTINRNLSEFRDAWHKIPPIE